MLEFCFIGENMRGPAGCAYDPEGQRKYLTRREGQRFLKETQSLPQSQRLFCRTLYYSGCRISEALSVRYRDVDVKSRVLFITTLKRRGKTVVRRVPIPAILAKELKCIPHDDNSTIWNFSRITGWRCVKDVMTRARIEGIHATAKGLRHGFGVRCALQQIPVTLIQVWMGHSDIMTTAIYLAVKDEEERELMKKTWN